MSGLLHKASLLSQNKGLAFNDFISKHNITTFAIFTQYNTFYYISQSIGFNADSILKSFSTLDFWEGLISEDNKVFNFSLDDKNIYPFMQFFSDELKDNVSSVSVYKNNDKIYLLVDKTISQEIIADFLILESSYSEKNSDSLLKCESINFEEAVNDYLLSHKVEQFLAAYAKNAITNEIFIRLFQYFSSSEVIKKESDYCLKVSVDEKIRLDLLNHHLKENLTDLIGKSTEKLIIK